MKKIELSIIILALFSSLLIFAQPKPKKPVTIATKTAKMDKKAGFIDYYWEESTGKIWLEINTINKEFLYVNSLPAGVGSNDIGLDRGQLGDNRVVKFMKSGNKLLLIQPNYSYRAVSDNQDEIRSVEEAFAQSVLWGFKIEIAENGKYLVDATGFLMQDAHDVIGSLSRSKQGKYSLDVSRSVVYLSSCKNFPKNTELEALLTFKGKAKGGYIRSVTPTSNAVSVRQRHSFIELPDKDYVPRVSDPRAGYFGISYQDYATPIGKPIVKRMITRHRLKKKNPKAAISEAVEPIVYYVDRGAPEPVRSALIEGASWWNQAFEAAGYKDAFQVKVLPKGADPMDVRYNVIQWVHRSTRGWSYGASVIDPRTGEIIKGHVSLGSLRVRQDFLIAQGLLSPYKGEDTEGSKLMLEMALARLRQLSAHEVGHTIGLAHNFAASSNDRSSVMDYPHPYVTLKNEELDFSNAYDDKIGVWDKQTVIYGYQEFTSEQDEAKELNKILQTTIQKGLRYISDQDARPQGGAHPYGHLWDNGKDAVAELERMSKVRAFCLKRFGQNSIPIHTPMSELGDVLAPLYLMHRYQVEGVVKLIGGLDYNYATKGDGLYVTGLIPAETQKKALNALLATLEPEFLALPESIIRLIPPKPAGLYYGRENFKTRTGITFDPLTAAESSADLTLRLLLNPQRASRLVEHHSRDNRLPSLEMILDKLINATWKKSTNKSYPKAVKRVVDNLVLERLLQLAVAPSAHQQVRSIVRLKLNRLKEHIRTYNLTSNAHYFNAKSTIERFELDPSKFKPMELKPLPAGSPIGCGEHF